VGFRQEASRLGGIGSCGRELCCSTWLTDFRSVNTSAARYQQLSLNPQKLAGQCGKLKCCLNYELDTYLDALKGLPDMDTKIYTEKGDAFCQKVDIFKGIMWFAYTNDMAHWHIIEAAQVKEMVALNKQKERVSSLEDYAIEAADETPEKNFQNAVGQDSLTRFDAPKKSNKKRPNKNKKPKAEVANNAAPAAGGAPKAKMVITPNTGGAKPAEGTTAPKPANSNTPRPANNRPPRQVGERKPNTNPNPEGGINAGANNSGGTKKNFNNKRRNPNQNPNQNPSNDKNGNDKK